MRIVLILLFILHGLIHFMGFVKAFTVGNTAESANVLLKIVGLIWLLTGLLFMVSASIILLKREGWPIIAILAVIASQILILTVWSDAKYGTLVNLIILLTASVAFGTERFEKRYRTDVRTANASTEIIDEMMTAKDIETLPPVVQKYLRYVGAVGKPKVYNVKIKFEGEMRDRGKDWFKFTSEQYNFFEVPTRLFFMKAKVKKLPINGYHKYTKDGAFMSIKLLSLFPVVTNDKPELFPTETVTFFNDLCLFAPSALIDDRIRWKVIDEQSVRATFTTNATSISAILHFNEKGQLVNFVSNDRYSVDEMKAFPFSTPASVYRNTNGYNLPAYGEAIWHYPDGQFVYGKFNVKSIQYNVENFKY